MKYILSSRNTNLYACFLVLKSILLFASKHQLFMFAPVFYSTEANGVIKFIL